MSFIVVTPVRNEAQYIEATINSVVTQTRAPCEWIVVNDGSTDETASIVETYAKVYPWLKLINRDRRGQGQDRQRGKGVIDAFYYGYERRTGDAHGFVVKLDGDVSFEPEYFEFLLTEFSANPHLGIAGGSLYERIDGKTWTLRSAPDHVRGPIKMYRRTCFEAIGGLEGVLGWDGIDEWAALAKGWEVRSFDEMHVFHHRATGAATGKLRSKLEQGYGAHYMGYYPLYTLARGIWHMCMRPYVIGGLTLVLGHLLAWLQGHKQYWDQSVLRYVRRTQRKQIASLLVGKRLYKDQV